jgi:hypothetical protein
MAAWGARRLVDRLGIIEQDVITTNIDETPLRDVRVTLKVNNRREIRFRPKRPKARLLEPLPKGHKVGKADLPRVYLQLELAEWQRAAFVFRKERVEHIEFGTLNVELENVDKGVAVELH